MISAREKSKCAAREAALRRQVYPRFVANGKLKQAEADREIEVMAEIAEDYRQKAEAEDARGRLV